MQGEESQRSSPGKQSIARSPSLADSPEFIEKLEHIQSRDVRERALYIARKMQVCVMPDG